MKRELTKYLGVYERKSDTRMYNGRADICFDITYKQDGKKIWEKVGWASEGYTAKVASQFKANRLVSIRHGEELPRKKQKVPYFKDVAAKYLEWAVHNKTREGRDDESRYRLSLAPIFDNKRLNEISSFDLERLKNNLTKEGYSPGSVKHCLMLFRQMFNKAILWGMHKGDNPIKGVKLPALQNQRERFLSYEEAEMLLNELKSISSNQLHDMALISLHCGLRAGEIFNLKAQDLDFDNELINISDPKNKETRKAYMTRAVKKILSNRVPESPAEYIFKDKRNGGRIIAISASYKKAVNRLGFNKGISDPRHMVTFHTLRHTFASWLALQSESLLTIKELLGHKTLAMTTRYAHLTPEHKRLATLNLEKAFNKKKGQKTFIIDVKEDKHD